MKTESWNAVAPDRRARFVACHPGLAVPLALCALVMPAARALAQPHSQLTQVTATSAGRSALASLSADGTRIAFVSTSDLTGENADGNPEIFLFDVSASAFTQITSSTEFFGTDEPSVSGDGTRIAFQSDADLTGGNTDANSEIFLFDTTNGDLIQVTTSTGFNGSFAPSISTDGTHVAFQSDRDLIGGDLSGLSDIFLFEVATGTITQITNSTGSFDFGCYGPSVSADGSHIAFGSDADLTGDNADGNNETFLFDAPTNTITQLTTSTGGVGHIPLGPAISADGVRVALFTDRDLTGGNADGNNEIFVVDTQSGLPIQITQSSGAGNALSSISADSTRIAFFSAGDLTGDNADGNTEVFLADTTTAALRQVTDSNGDFGSFFPSIDAGGRRLAFDSDRDLTGDNPDGNSEVFLFADVFSCAAGDVPCLIAAINAANANPDADTIVLEAGTYTLTQVDNDTDLSGANGLPLITSPITIQGAGAAATIVERGPVLPFRMLQVESSGTLTLESLTLQNGFIPERNGGGILNFGDTTIVHSVLSENATDFGIAGGIYNSGTLTVTESRVDHNHSRAFSVGGIANVGTMTIHGSTVNGNTAESVAGIRNSGVASITNSAITGNRASSSGPGGIGNDAMLTIQSSTVSGNTAFFGGGGIGQIAGSLTIRDSTVANNKVFNPGSAIGGGIESIAGTVEIQNTILAHNTGNEPAPGPDCSGPVTSLGHNLVGDPSGCTITLLASDLTGDPGLDSFEDDGTPGNGHFPLLAASAAVDAGDNASCTPTDQIGHVRNDGDGDGSVVCDIGAVELVLGRQIVNELVTLESLETSFDPTPAASARAGTFTIEARFTNTSSTALHDVVFKVADLSGGSLLLNAAGGPGGIGSSLTPDVGPDGILSPGESLTATFVIGLERRRRFRFFVDVVGVPEVTVGVETTPQNPPRRHRG